MISTSVWLRRFYAWGVFWGLLVTLGLFLGLWQWERANDKRVLLAARAAAPALTAPQEMPQDGAMVRLAGEYLPQHTLFLDNRVLERRLGVAVLTPFRDIHGQLWLIQRGFMETGPDRSAPHAQTPGGNVEILGEWQTARPGGPLYGDNQEGIRLQQMSLAPWEKTLAPFSYQGWLHAVEGEGVFLPWWKANVMPPSRHVGYAFQWWGLTLAAFVVMLLGGYRMRKDRLQ
ncbi:SURF1 family protein [Vreelandella venusta]|uniref:SURF1 family protein n=1 Tax=Vreelandella venusta TaxID=44935 RepID=UPI003850DD87